MMRPMLFRAASALALAAALLARPASAQDKTPGPMLLPKAVYLYLSAPDVATLKERVKGSAFGEMLKDPKLQGTYDQIKEKAAEAGGKLEQELGVTLADLLKVPAGEVSVGVFNVPGSTDDGGVGVVAVLDYGDNESTVKTLIEKAEAAIEKKGGTRSTEDFEGTEIVLYTKAGGTEKPADDDLDIGGAAPAAGGGGVGGKVGWFRKDGRVVIGNGAPALEAVLARWDGKHEDTLGSNEIYAYVSEKTRSDDRAPVLTWYADPIGAVQAVMTRSQGGPPQLQMAAAFLPMLGVTKLKAFGGSMDVATEEFDTVSKAFLYVEQPATGILGMFQFPPAELAPPAWVPASASMYFGANWDVATAVSSVKSLVDQFQGPGAFDQLMNKAATANPSAKLHPQKDLLDQLTGRIDLMNFPADAVQTTPQGVPAAQQPTVIAIGVKDEGKMKELLGRLSQTQGFPGSKRDFQGTTVYELPTPNPAGGEPGKTAFAVTKGNLTFSTDVARMEEILRSGGAPLADSTEYKAIAEHFPAQVSMISYSDQSDQLKVMYEAFRSGQFSQQIQGFDFSVLPAFEDIARYFRTGGAYAVPDANGALFVSFSLKLDK